jgi:hypothetical protein
MTSSMSEASELDGYEDLKPEDQKKVSAAFAAGKVADEDIPESAKKPGGAGAGEEEDEDEEKPKKKKAPAKKEKDADAEAKPKRSRAKVGSSKMKNRRIVDFFFLWFAESYRRGCR